MMSRLTLPTILAGLVLLPGCFCVSWRKYEPAGARPAQGTFDDDFTESIDSTHSGLSVFIQNSGPPFSLSTDYEIARPYVSYTVEQADLEWSDGHRETLATPADGYRANAVRTTGYQGKIVYRAKLELPRTFDHVPAEGTEVTLRMRVTVSDGAGKHVHRIEKKYRFEHQKECHPITIEALGGA